MKKVLSIILSLVLFVTLIPVYGPSQTVSANTSLERAFNFPNEGTSRASARVVTADKITLNGTLSSIVGNSISYEVLQVPVTGTEVILDSRPDSDLNITISGNKITVRDIQLFPGMNKIQFTGRQGASIIKDAIYIEYRNSPMLNNLEFQYEEDGNKYQSIENQPIIIRQPNTPQPRNIVHIKGEAPNATLIVMEFNGRKYQYTPTSSNEFYFGNVPLDNGINTAVFTISTSTYELVSTKQIVLYSEAPVFFEQMINLKETDTDNNQAYITNGEYTVGSNVTNVLYTGKVIVPKPFALDATRTTSDSDEIKSHIESNLNVTINDVIPIVESPSLVEIKNDGTDFAEFYFEIPLFSSANIATQYGKTTSFTRVIEIGDSRQFTQTNHVNFLDGSKTYIADVNYLPSYNPTSVVGIEDGKYITFGPQTSISNFEAMRYDDIPSNGVNISSIPFMVELLIGEYTTMTSSEFINALEVTSGGAKVNIRPLVGATGSNLVTEQVYREVNGQMKEFTRIFVEITNLRVAGSNNVTFKFKSAAGNNFNLDAKQYRFNLMSGPYVRFDSIVDGMNIEYFSREVGDPSMLQKLGSFKGQLYNLPNNNEIVYEYKADGTKSSPTEQTVFLHLNNVEVPLKPNSNNITSFELVGLNTSGEVQAGSDLEKALGALNKGGNNILEFTFYSKSYNFTSTYNFTIMPKDLPKIPASDKTGVFPYYNASQWPPVYDNADYQLTGSTYTTRREAANLFGSFYLLNLNDVESSGDATDRFARVQEKISAINSSQVDNFKLVISSPEWDNQTFEWSLSNAFYVVDSDLNFYNAASMNVGSDISQATAVNAGSVAQSPTGSVRVLYNTDDNHFYFNMYSQKMPLDNSPMVFIATVYNAGVGGPSASYRLEINPVSIPYTRHLPEPEVKVINSNYTEVIISAPGADSVLINKQVAEPIKYTSFKNATPDNPNGVEVDAFRVLVKNLKANRDTNIPISITRAGITNNDSFTIKYVPTTIPGAEYIETLKSSHKVFDGALTLAFEKNTNLIRSTHANQIVDPTATQVYNSHDILFSIAHPSDGIVNRHLFQPTGSSKVGTYKINSQRDGSSIATYEFLNHAGRFIKASQLFWIDAGLADDPSTANNFDPISAGIDPFPFPDRPNIEQYSVGNRINLKNREIVPSKPGKITLKYDNNIVASASATVTVFHYDPVTKLWENIGGVVDSKKGTITAPFTKFGYYVVAKLTRSFNDITYHAYARDAMEAVFAKGIMNAENITIQFGGDQYVTRGEFARMIVKALELPLNYEGTPHFSYYPETISNELIPTRSLYDHRHIETAARAGIVNGTAPGFFDEIGQLTRQDAAVILARALELKLETSSEKAKRDVAKAFQDSGNMNLYAIPSILAMQKKGYIKGIQIDTSNPKSGFVYQPTARMLRSDAAIIIARVMIDQKKLSPIFF